MRSEPSSAGKKRTECRQQSSRLPAYLKGTKQRCIRRKKTCLPTEQTTPVVSSQSPSAAWLDRPHRVRCQQGSSALQPSLLKPPESPSPARGLSITAWASEIDVTTAEFAAPALDESDYQSIPVPATLKLEGLRRPAYVNIQMPWTATKPRSSSHPRRTHVALYRKHCTLEGDLKKMLERICRIVLAFRRLRNRNLRVG